MYILKISLIYNSFLYEADKDELSSLLNLPFYEEGSSHGVVVNVLWHYCKRVRTPIEQLRLVLD